MAAKIRIRVPNWREFNPRTDVKKPSWFRLAHDLFENEDFYKFSQAEILSWLYILCACSKKNSDSVTIDIDRVVKVGRILEADFRSAVAKLKSMKCIKMGSSRTSRARNASGTATNATDGRTDETERNGGDAPTPPDLESREAKAWGELIEAEEYYRDQYEKKFKVTPFLTEKDQAALQNLLALKGMTLKRLKKLINLYVYMNDTYFERNGWNLQTLETDLQKVVAKEAA